MMEPIVLDTDFRALKILDAYKALIWTERYDRAGDFEFYAPITSELISIMTPGRYLYLKESSKVMIIEAIELSSNSSRENEIKVSGRSLESILDRRIIWNQTSLDGYINGQIKKLINEAIISPSNTDRKINNFIFQDSTDSVITSLRIESQYTGTNLYKVITSICEEAGIGFEITLNAANEFVFRLYNGKDRTHAQNTNAPVVFSSNFDNLLDSTYKSNAINYRTIALVAGEGEGEERRRVIVETDPQTGLERRELYVDARDVCQQEGASDAEYEEQLTQRAKEKMVEYTWDTSIGGSIDTTIGAKFGTDFFLGDIVEVQNEYGIGFNCRVTELIRSMKTSGYYEYPTFEML